MDTISVTVVRIYTLEGSSVLKKVIAYLRDEAKVRGVSVFRAVNGFGESGSHSTSIVNLSFALPLVIEFFDHPEKVEEVLEFLSPMLKSEHILFFPAQVNV